jgi:aminomethyltransferase
MSSPTIEEPVLRRTPLAAVHAELGAKMVSFGGYLMPVHYADGITAEHLAVRQRCGVFDVSHMGELVVRGPQALDFVNAVTSNDASTLAVGQVQYSTILNDRGTIEDDCLVYRFADRLMLVVNASNHAKVWRRLAPYADRFDCMLDDESDETALLAVQGPLAQRVVQPLTAIDLDTVRYYHFALGIVAGVSAVVSRTGYTGEDGFELYVAAGDAIPLWRAVTARPDVSPAGLGARDTLRLEMGMALYGHEIDDTTTPLEANLGWVVKLAKGDFVGRDALLAQKASGCTRRLVGFQMSDRAFPRQGYRVLLDGRDVGEVCSGTVSPSLGVPIGTCYLPSIPSGAPPTGTKFEVDIRGRPLPAAVVRVPFYTRGTNTSHR